MLRWFTALCLLLCASQAGAQGYPTLLGVGTANRGAAPGYTGPGDVVSGAYAWYGIDRCYNNVYAGNVVDVVDASTGSTTGTRLQCAPGNIITAVVSASACTFVTGNACSSLAITCAVSCVAVNLYNQSGGGGGTCTQPTNSKRPIYVASVIGSLAALQFTSAASMELDCPSAVQSQQIVVVAYAKRNSTFTTGNDIFLNGSEGGFFNSANTAFLFSGSFLSHAATDSAFHVLQFVLNGASSIMSVDGSVTAGAGGTTGFTGSTMKFCDGTCNIYATELGVWGNAVTYGATQIGAMNTNLSSFY